MLKALHKPFAASASAPSLEHFFSGTGAPGSPLRMPPRPQSATASRSVTPLGWKDRYNKMEGECRWPYPPPRAEETKDCAFPFIETTPLDADPSIKLVTLPAGTRLYHATTIYPGKPVWFESPAPHATLPLTTRAVWFASSPDHAKHIGFTHLLEYTLEKDAQLLFIQNLKTTFGRYGVTTGKELLKNPAFAAHVTKNAVVGYAGCNECEIAFCKEHLQTPLPSAPTVLETRPLSMALGGSRRAGRQRTRRAAKHKRRPRSTLRVKH